MRQYLLPASFKGEKTLQLENKESKYLTKVLRLKVGSSFLGRDKWGHSWQLEILEIKGQGCTLGCTPAKEGIQVQSTDTLPSYLGPYPKLFLFQCLCKGKKEEQIVRQTTELGVQQICLVASRHCVRDVSDKSQSALDSRFDRLETQIKEAIQQSGSPIPTCLERNVLPLSTLPSYWDNRGLAIFFHQSERSEQQNLTSLLKNHPIDQPVAVLIGPEGGFSHEECTFLEESGFKAVLLPTNILRSETAGIYALSAIQVLLSERDA